MFSHYRTRNGCYLETPAQRGIRYGSLFLLGAGASVASLGVRSCATAILTLTPVSAEVREAQSLQDRWLTYDLTMRPEDQRQMSEEERKLYAIDQPRFVALRGRTEVDAEIRKHKEEDFQSRLGFGGIMFGLIGMAVGTTFRPETSWYPRCPAHNPPENDPISTGRLGGDSI